MKKADLIKKVEYYQNLMGLINWDINVSFRRLRHPTKENEYMTGIAKIERDSQYKLATIYFDPRKLDLIDDSTIIHEMLHCFTAPLAGYIRGNVRGSKTEAWLDYYEEQMISEIERIFMRIIRAKETK